MRLSHAFAAVVIGLPGDATAQTTDSLNLQGRHIVALGLGVTGTREASATPAQAGARSTGAMASLAYTQFVGSSVAFEIAVTALDANAGVNYSSTQSSAVTALLLGLNHSPRQLAITPSIRPFVSVAIGPYFHSVTQASWANGVNASTQSRLGGRLGAGANVQMARHLVLLLETDYHAVSRFDAVNGTAVDPTGLSLTLGLGLSWGR